MSTTEIYTLSLHDALPISRPVRGGRDPSPHRLRARAGTVGGGAARPAPPAGGRRQHPGPGAGRHARRGQDRKSTRLNSSHEWISYAVFCLKKKKKNIDRKE